MNSLLLLIDGNALIHRAFHAIPPLTVSKTGEVINAVYGFINTLLKVVNEFQPEYWAIAFDKPGPTFRHKLYEGYKAQREKTPEELIKQIIRVHDVVSALGMPIFEIDNYEADDVLGTLSRKAVDLGLEAIITTGDNDVLQLLEPGVKAFMPRRSFNDTFLYDSQSVKERYGVNPDQMIDFKALIGDSSDNITGVPGIGNKTAAKLLQSYYTIEQIYSHIDDIKPLKLQQALRDNRDHVYENKQLVTIVKEVPIELNLDDCRVVDYDREKVVEIFRDLEFTRLLSKLPSKSEAITGIDNQTDSNSSYELLDTQESFNHLNEQIEGIGEAVILEIPVTKRGNSKGVKVTELLEGIAVSTSLDKHFFLRLEKETAATVLQAPLSKVIALKQFMEADQIEKTVYDGKECYAALAHYGIDLKNVKYDLKLAAYLLGDKNLSLPSIILSRLGREIPSIEGPPGVKGKLKTKTELSIEQLIQYVKEGIQALWDLKSIFEKELNENSLWELYKNLELPLVPVLVEMERNGIAIDIPALHSFSQELGDELKELEKNIYGWVGYEFNINSSKQLGRILFDELKLPQVRRGKRSYSTEASVLEELIGTHPTIELILQYRQISKLKSTYVDVLPALVDQSTGRIHTTLSQTGTATGRLASSDPNLQNIPIRSKLGNEIRKAIIAPTGSYLLSADYSQIDLRALAHLSQDTALISSFNNDEDIHSITAARIFEVDPQEVTAKMRRDAKAINFGVIYGMSDYGLARATGMTRDEAANFISRYFERYPDVRKFLDRTKMEARKLGYVKTLLGRKRFLSDMNSENRIVRESAERMAINAPVQGTSADIIKVAMLEIYKWMYQETMTSKMLLQIHDELLFEVPEKELESMKKTVTTLMSKAVQLSVPLKITVKVGRNWGEMAAY